MNHAIDELIQKMHELEEELEVEYRRKREKFDFVIKEKRVRFAEEVARQQLRFKIGWFRYLIKAKPLNVLTAPVIYAGFIPFIILDLFFWLYQSICFPVYGIPKTKRSDYLIFDREDLP